MIELVTQWTTPAGGDHVSVTYYEGNSSANAEQIRDEWGALLGDLDGRLGSEITWTLATEGRILDPSTGVMTAGWTDGRPMTGTGAGGSTLVPDAAQVLIRWHTGQVVDGRFLQGRTFLPGLVVGSLQAGNVSAAAVTQFNGWLLDYLDVDPGLVVWSRPRPDRPGVSHLVDTGTVWSELAVLRGRRG